MGNLEYFKVFYYTAKLGSVTGAANALSLSQPAVSQSLKALETSLGVTLFQRAPYRRGTAFVHLCGERL